VVAASFIALFALAAPNPTAAKGEASAARSTTAAREKPVIPDLEETLRALVAGKESALGDLERIHASRPKDLRVVFALGTAHKLAGKTEAAIRVFRIAADLAKKDDGIHAARPWWGLVRLYRDAKLENEAAAARNSFIDVARTVKGLEAVVKRIEDGLKKPSPATPGPTPTPAAPR
jgi:hypothetical protein